MSQDAKDVVRRYFELANTKAFDQVRKIMSPDFVNHDAPEGVPPTREGYREIHEGYVEAFPDHEIEPETMIAEGDLVATRWRVTGTHEGPLHVGDIPATGRRVEITGITINRVEDGQIVEQWEQTDVMGLMAQLGVLEGKTG